MCLVTQSCLTLCNPVDCSPPGSSVRGDSPGKNTGVGCRALLQGIFPTQGSNTGLLHCRRILYHLSHQGSPRILEWVASPSPGDLPNPGIKTGSPALQVDSLPAELPGKPIWFLKSQMSFKAHHSPAKIQFWFFMGNYSEFLLIKEESSFPAEQHLKG